MTTNDPNPSDDDVLLWGAGPIGAAIGKTARAARHDLWRGKIRCAVKRDGKWTAWRRKLRAEYGLTDARQGNGSNAELRGA